MIAVILAVGACPWSAAQVVVAKQHYSFQSDATTAQEDTEDGPWTFLTQVGTAAAGASYTVTPPGASALALQNFTGNTSGGPSGAFATAYYQRLFSAQADIDAAFPDGAYSVTTDAATATAALAGAYPDAVLTSFQAVAPTPTHAVSGGAQWTNGVLVWDTTYDLTLTFRYPGAFVPGSSLLQATFFTVPVAFNSSPEYNAGSTSFEASNAPDLTADTLTVKLLHNSASPIKVFEVVATAQNLGTYAANPSLPGGLIAGSHESRTSFFLEYDSYQGRPVRLTQQLPQLIRTAVGAVLTLQAGANGDPDPAYQWYHGSTKIAGATGASLSYTVQAGDDNTYLAYTAANKLGQTRSTLCSLRVFAGPPVIITQPPSQTTANPGTTVKFTAAPQGSVSDFAIQWYKDSVAIPGAVGATLTLANVQAGDAGGYSAVITSPGGSATSSTATLKIVEPSGGGASGPPLLSPNALNSQILGAGTSTVFTVRAANAQGATYQWYFNGAPISGANSPQLLLFNVGAANVGSYSCAVTNSAGSATTNAATLTLTTGPFATDPGRLINLSVLSTALAAGAPFTVGFRAGGEGATGNENVLIRATGPALAAPPFSQAGILADPAIAVFAQGFVAPFASNDNWSDNAAAVTAAESATGAFALAAGSLDAALTQSLGAGGYSVQITGKGDGGLALGEIYEVTGAGPRSATPLRLTNLSCINAVGAKGVLTAGFTIGGTGPRVLLIRGMGPALGALGVGGAMADPTITLFGTINGQQSTQGSNAAWGGDATLTAACRAVQAFLPSDPASRDAMLLTTQLPGSYSVQLTSASGAAGEALIEVYEIP